MAEMELSIQKAQTNSVPQQRPDLNHQSVAGKIKGHSVLSKKNKRGSKFSNGAPHTSAIDNDIPNLQQAPQTIPIDTKLAVMSPGSLDVAPLDISRPFTSPVTPVGMFAVDPSVHTLPVNDTTPAARFNTPKRCVGLVPHTPLPQRPKEASNPRLSAGTRAASADISIVGPVDGEAELFAKMVRFSVDQCVVALPSTARADILNTVEITLTKHNEDASRFARKRSEVLARLDKACALETLHEQLAQSSNDCAIGQLTECDGLPNGHIKDDLMRQVVQSLRTASGHSKKATEFHMAATKCRETLDDLNHEAIKGTHALHAALWEEIARVLRDAAKHGWTLERDRANALEKWKKKDDLVETEHNQKLQDKHVKASSTFSAKGKSTGDILGTEKRKHTSTVVRIKQNADEKLPNVDADHDDMTKKLLKRNEETDRNQGSFGAMSPNNDSNKEDQKKGHKKKRIAKGRNTGGRRTSTNPKLPPNENGKSQERV